MPRRSTGSLGTWMLDSPIRYWYEHGIDRTYLYRTNEDDPRGVFAPLEEWRDGGWIAAGPAVAGDLINLDAKPCSAEEAQRLIELGWVERRPPRDRGPDRPL